jgi:hypothetical protein
MVRCCCCGARLAGAVAFPSPSARETAKGATPPIRVVTAKQPAKTLPFMTLSLRIAVLDLQAGYGRGVLLNYCT